MADSEDDPHDYASSPCFAHELAGESMPIDELLAELNTLIEAERAGTRGLLAMAHQCDGQPLAPVLHDIARDEARFCSMLSHHVSRLGGQPSHQTGEFLEKLLKRSTLDAQLALVDRGQRAVVTMVESLLMRVDDVALKNDLVVMRDDHERNLLRAAEASR